MVTSHIVYKKYIIIQNIIAFNILDPNVYSKIIYTKGAKSTLTNIIGSVLSLQEIRK